ncbi:MAG: hypothetical protein KGZ58_12485 [Ignavibacteriales bacterium]|nr:hypothetical protein [Ignavibacteriales bacterium]
MTILVILFFSSSLFSQQTDSLSYSKQNTISEQRQSKSSTQAVLLSLALPGLGQIYNESYWKTPVILGFVGYFGYVWKQENDLYHKYQAEYILTSNPQDRKARDFYHDERDRFAWYLGVTYLLSAVDAYVDAQLFDFDVDTSLGYSQQMSMNQFTVRYFFNRK